MVTTHTLEVALLQARPHIVVSGPSRLEYDAVALERDHFDSIRRSLADHTSRLEDDFANLFIEPERVATLCNVAFGICLRISGYSLILLMV